MKRFTKAIVTAVVLGCFGSCGGQSSTDGNTNWLQICTTGADCAEGLTCECGVCTRRCVERDDCDDLDRGSVCRVRPAECSGNGAICLLPCVTTAECGGHGAGLACVGGACLASTQRIDDGGVDASAASVRDAGDEAKTTIEASTGGGCGVTPCLDGSAPNLPDASRDAGVDTPDGLVATAEASRPDALVVDAPPDAPVDPCSHAWPPKGGPGVYRTYIPAEPPVATGGTLPTGLFQLTAINVYTGIDGSAGTGNGTTYWRIDISASGDAFLVEAALGWVSAALMAWGDYLWTVSGNQVTVDPLCIDGAGSGGYTFTATQDEIRLYSVSEEFILQRFQFP